MVTSISIQPDADLLRTAEQHYIKINVFFFLTIKHETFPLLRIMCNVRTIIEKLIRIIYQ